MQIFTEPMYLTDDYYFKNFYNSKTRGNWKVGVYSYYYVYKYVADPRYDDQLILIVLRSQVNTDFPA